MLETVELRPIKEYTQRNQATIVEQVAYQPIYELYTGAESIPGYSWFIMWWYQDVGWEVE